MLIRHVLYNLHGSQSVSEIKSPDFGMTASVTSIKFSDNYNMKFDYYLHCDKLALIVLITLNIGNK